MEKEEVIGEPEAGEMDEAGEVPEPEPRLEVEMLLGRVRLKVELVGEAGGGVTVLPEVVVLIPKDLKEEEEVGREGGLAFREVGRRVEDGREAARRI